MKGIFSRELSRFFYQFLENFRGKKNDRTRKEIQSFCNHLNQRDQPFIS